MNVYTSFRCLRFFPCKLVDLYRRASSPWRSSARKSSRLSIPRIGVGDRVSPRSVSGVSELRRRRPPILTAKVNIHPSSRWIGKGVCAGTIKKSAEGSVAKYWQWLKILFFQDHVSPFAKLLSTPPPAIIRLGSLKKCVAGKLPGLKCTRPRRFLYHRGGNVCMRQMSSESVSAHADEFPLFSPLPAMGAKSPLHNRLYQFLPKLVGSQVIGLRRNLAELANYCNVSFRDEFRLLLWADFYLTIT